MWPPAWCRGELIALLGERGTRRAPSGRSSSGSSCKLGLPPSALRFARLQHCAHPHRTCRPQCSSRGSVRRSHRSPGMRHTAPTAACQTRCASRHSTTRPAFALACTARLPPIAWLLECCSAANSSAACFAGRSHSVAVNDSQRCKLSASQSQSVTRGGTGARAQRAAKRRAACRASPRGSGGRIGEARPGAGSSAPAFR